MKPIIAVLIFIFSFSIAQAKTHNYIPGFARLNHHHHIRHHPTSANYSAGRPSAWCGWWMRQQVGSDPGAAFNLARMWARWGHPAPLVPGAIVVYSHHVVKVTRVIGGGRFVAISGNDGHAVRERPRSLAGAIAVRI